MIYLDKLTPEEYKNLIKPKKNKYNSMKNICKSDHIHDSVGESTYCDKLRLLKNIGEIKSYEIQKKYELIVNGVRVASHYVDFEIINKDGSQEIHEYKGVQTALWKLKKKIFEAIYPNKKYKVINHK